MRHSRITQKDVFFLSASFFAVVVAWIAFSLYHSYVTTTISEDLQIQIVPIAPKFDTETIEKLKSRKKVEPLFQLSSDQQASAPALLLPEEGAPPSDPIEESIDELNEIITEEEVSTEEPTL